MVARNFKQGGRGIGRVGCWLLLLLLLAICWDIPIATLQCIAVVAVCQVRDDGVRHSHSGLMTGEVLLVVIEVMRMQFTASPR
jgi:hypothetical protein